MLELYHAHISTCSQKVRLCLAEKGLEWTSHPIEFFRGEHLTPAYLALNPNGVVPTLVHDGRPVIDSSVICEYLEEIAPDDVFGLKVSGATYRI
jgi:glutathione S-transferase